MPRGDKGKYTEKQKRKAEHIEHAYEDKGLAKEEAEARAWATVNKQSGGGEKQGGSGNSTRHGHARASSSSLESQTKESLLKEARSKAIKGRSSMTKAELIAALRNHG